MTPSTVSPASPVLECLGLQRHFRMGDADIHVLRGVDFQLADGEFVAIEGRSGSGKSTLLHVLAGLDAPQKGSIVFGGEDIAALAMQADLARSPRAARGILGLTRLLYDPPAARLSELRNRHFGFVFQFYHLLPELDVFENAMLSPIVGRGSLAFRGEKAALRERAKELLTTLGLGHRLTHRPSQLSGGERQRVAIARALMNKPKILFADEPTGNLDSETGGQIMDVLNKLHAGGQTILMVTHDRTIAKQADRSLVLRDGRMTAG